ncbi:MAG TPA: hypothetical protein VK181_00100 [Rhizobium sp.]|nr:hypothetical protein [Rhizobium sp.]
MKDILKQVVIGFVLVVLTAISTTILAKSDKPDVQLLIERPMVLKAERIVLFRLVNAGGAVADHVSLRFAAAVAGSSIVPVEGIDIHWPAVPGPEMRLERLRPKEEATFYIKDAPDSLADVRGLLRNGLYDQGTINITTNDDRLAAFGSAKAIAGGVIGFIVAGVFFILVLALAILKDKKRDTKQKQTKAEPEIVASSS